MKVFYINYYNKKGKVKCIEFQANSVEGAINYILNNREALDIKEVYEFFEQEELDIGE